MRKPECKRPSLFYHNVVRWIIVEIIDMTTVLEGEGWGWGLYFALDGAKYKI